MEKQFEKQYEQFQDGVKSVFEAGQKVAEPSLRSGEVVVESLSQLAKDQFEFGNSCMNIGRKQFESMQTNSDMTALFSDKGAANDYYAAARNFGEALRKNAENTFETLTAIGRESTKAATDAGSIFSDAVTAQAKAAGSK